MTYPFNHSDIPLNNWIDQLPVVLRPFARLMRLDRPIGIWLLALPCCWGVALAASTISDLWLMLPFACGAVVMRSAGCIVNDIYDRELDAEVVRTQNRPLASGAIALWQAVLLLALLLLIGFGILLVFNRLTIILGIASLALVFGYPLMKRITWWPQLFLGFTFNWGALLGWTAVQDGVGLPPLLLYAAGVFWTLGYDTIYAHQDVRDDEIAGIKSTARLFGRYSLAWVALFYTLAIVLLALAGAAAGLARGFQTALVIATGFVVVELMRWRMNDPANCLARFRHNREFGLIILAGIILDRVL